MPEECMFDHTKELAWLEENEPDFKTYRNILKRALEQFCVNLPVIYRDILGYESLAQARDDAVFEWNCLKTIEEICKKFHIWEYTEPKMYQYRDLVWEVSAKNPDVGNNAAIIDYVEEELFEYFYDGIWLAWCGGNYDKDYKGSIVD